MTKRCQVTRKKTTRGFRYAIRGIAKKKKGIGLKVTGKTKRRFLPNLQKKRFWLAEENRFVFLRLSAHAMRIVDKKGIKKIVGELRSRGERV